MFNILNSSIKKGEQDVNLADWNDGSVLQEQLQVVDRLKEGRSCPGLRLAGLEMTYHHYPFGIESQHDVTALRGVYLEVQDGILLSILGHNGAGKSTLINILTGMFPPSAGTAFICNYNIHEDLDNIRAMIGFCPQFDILWDELTAEEHLHLYAELKGLDPRKVRGETQRRLDAVDLWTVRDHTVKTFSGGMKRRLSMAIAAIADPKVIFLDEPTTGMDPNSRREIWRLIEDLKRDRVVILTTHAMDEADALSDRIAVMCDGTLRCIGTPLYLKNHYGDGYRLSLVTDPANVPLLRVKIKELIPESNLLDEKAGSFIFTIPFNYVKRLRPFFRVMEGKEKHTEWETIKAVVKDWGLSHTTLEEVFLKITRKGRV